MLPCVVFSIAAEGDQPLWFFIIAGLANAKNNTFAGRLARFHSHSRRRFPLLRYLAVRPEDGRFRVAWLDTQLAKGKIVSVAEMQRNATSQAVEFKETNDLRGRLEERMMERKPYRGGGLLCVFSWRTNDNQFGFFHVVLIRLAPW
jgi:hypothetical protein